MVLTVNTSAFQAEVAGSNPAGRFMDDNTIRLELDEEDFPIQMRAYREDTDELVWEETVEMNREIFIPPLAQIYGVSISTETEYPDGTITRTYSDGRQEEVQQWWQAVN